MTTPAMERLVQEAAAGRSPWKLACRVVSTANITLQGLQTIDGVVVAEGDRVLVAGQTNGAENGIRYASTGKWIRAVDMDDNEEFVIGIVVQLAEGSAYGRSTWTLSAPTNGPMVKDVTSLSFAMSISSDAALGGDPNIDAFTSGTAILVPSGPGHINKLSTSVVAASLPKATLALVGKSIVVQLINNVDIPVSAHAVTPPGIANVTFAAGGHTLTRLAGSWLDEGHAAGETLVVSGSVSNNGTLHPTNVTALVITVSETLASEVDAGKATYAGSTDTINGSPSQIIPGASDPERTVVTIVCDGVGSWTYGGNGGFRVTGLARATTGRSGSQTLAFTDGCMPWLHMGANGSISFGSIPQRGFMRLRLECDSGVTSVTLNAATVFQPTHSLPGSNVFTAAALASVCSALGAIGGYNIYFDLEAWGGIVVLRGWSISDAIVTTFTNVCLKSEKFDTSPWSPTAGTISANVVTAPDGTSNADAFMSNSTGSSDHSVHQPEPTIAGGQPFTFSCYLKAGAVNYAALVADGTFKFIFFTLTGAGTVGANYFGEGSGGIEPASVTIPGAGTDWYRCWVTGTRAHADFRLEIHPASGPVAGNETYAPAASGVAQIYMWGAQEVQASIAGDYVATP